MAKKQNVFNAGKKSQLPFAGENSSRCSTLRCNHFELQTPMSYGRENQGISLPAMSTPTRHIGINNINEDSQNESFFRQAMTEDNCADYSIPALSLALKYFIRLVRILETNPEIKKTLKGGKKQLLCGGLGTGIGTGIGVLFVGPVGAVVGGVVGALIGRVIVDDYTPLMKVLRNLSDAEKQRLAKEVQNLVRSASIEMLEDFVKSKINCELLVNCVRSFSKTKQK